MRWLSVIVAGLILFLYPTAVHSQDSIVAVITSPVEGQQLFGLVNISGSAASTASFASYTLEYNNQADPAAPWFLVQERVTQQVQDGVLGTWNTNMVPDGVYQIRLRVFLNDGQVGEYIVPNLRVINTSPTPVPTVASGGEGPATPGPSPTSPVEQPPSNNPDAGSFTGLDTANDSTNSSALTTTTSGSTTRINMGRVRNAFCVGVYITLGLFGAMFGYLLIRGRLRA